jgi:3-oxoacyl-[acyl-carrier protein] reductase
VLTRRLDVRSETDWESAIDAAIEAWGAIDVVMNIAGYLRPGYAKEVTLRDIELHLDVNVKGTILGTRAAARRMVAARRGHIINFGSLASLAPVPGLCLYSASKFAVRGFTLAAATELREHGVDVTLIMPDAVQTPMLDLQVGYDEAALTFSGDRPLTVEDIEALIVDKVLVKRPMEVAIPASRGALARLANAAPELSKKMAPLLIGKGRKAQERIKTSRARAEAEAGSTAPPDQAREHDPRP